MFQSLPMNRRPKGQGDTPMSVVGRRGGGSFSSGVLDNFPPTSR